MLDQMKVEVFAAEFGEWLCALAVDPVLNVRLAVARLLYNRRTSECTCHAIVYANQHANLFGILDE